MPLRIIDFNSVSTSVVPASNVTYDLGTVNNAWKDLILSGNTINLGGASISVDDTSGSVAFIPKATVSTPSPTATVIRADGVVSVNTANGVLVSNSIAAASPSGSGTTVYANSSDLPLSGVDVGAQAYVSETNRLYMRTNTGWYNIALINQSPTITSGSDATYELNSNGAPTVITLTATDPEDFPITWSYTVTSGSLEDTTVTNVGGVFTITPGTVDAIFDLTFTASDGVNLATSVSAFSLSFFSEPGQQQYTTPGTYSWTAPAGVTSVSVVAVGGGGGGGATGGSGGGGGGGGGLGWKNNIAVFPGQSYTVVVGAGGTRDSTTHGGDSYFINTSTVAGFGGLSSINASRGAGGGYVGDGGGNGGSPNNSGTVDSTGGGGAGGYSGNGGGSAINRAGYGGSGGAGGGGAAGGSEDAASGGGGVGLQGEGASGGGGAYTGADAGAGGAGGSGGDAGGSGAAGGANNNGGNYGGGGGGAEVNGESGNGAGGAVRIIWGDGRAFPSTNAQDV